MTDRLSSSPGSVGAAPPPLRLPGRALLALAHRVWSPRTVSEIFEPTLRDVQDEWLAARSDGRALLAAWVRMRGVATLGVALVARALSSSEQAPSPSGLPANLESSMEPTTFVEPPQPAATDYLSEWDRVHATITSHSAECRRIAAWAELKAGARVLDVACGTGQHLAEFARRGHPCFGSDQLWWKIVRAVHQAGSQGLAIKFACADLRTLRLRPSYDLVLCLYAMSMMRRDEDLLAALAVARGALAPGGRFVFNVLANEGLGDGPQVFQDDHLRTYAAGEVEGFLARSGLVPIRIEKSPIPGFDSFDLNYVCRKEDAP